MSEPSGMDAWMRAARVVKDTAPPKGVGGAVCHDPVSFVLAYGEECAQAERERVLAELKAALRREYHSSHEEPGAVARCIARLRGKEGGT